MRVKHDIEVEEKILDEIHDIVGDIGTLSRDLNVVEKEHDEFIEESREIKAELNKNIETMQTSMKNIMNPDEEAPLLQNEDDLTDKLNDKIAEFDKIVARIDCVCRRIFYCRFELALLYQKLLSYAIEDLEKTAKILGLKLKNKCEYLSNKIQNTINIRKNDMNLNEKKMLQTWAGEIEIMVEKEVQP